MKSKALTKLLQPYLTRREREERRAAWDEQESRKFQEAMASDGWCSFKFGAPFATARVEFMRQSWDAPIISTVGDFLLPQTDVTGLYWRPCVDDAV